MHVPSVLNMFFKTVWKKRWGLSSFFTLLILNLKGYYKEIVKVN